MLRLIPRSVSIMQPRFDNVVMVDSDALICELL
jgi:hypothetical protein